VSVLTIDVAVDAAAAAASLLGVSDAARGVGDAVAAAGAQVEEGAGRIDRAAESADGLASTSSTLTGALGALGSGLSLVGLDEYAAGLEQAAMATDFFSGVGDLAALAMNSQAVKTVAATVASVAHTAATTAASVATGVMTAAQAALNAVMAANPVGLVVLAIVALTAGIVLAYKHSETFREVIDKAMDVARAGVDLVVDGVQKFLGWLADLPGKARDAWDRVSGAVGDAVDAAQRFFGDLIADVRDKPGEVVAGVKSAFDSMFAPIRDAIAWVQDLLDKLSQVKLPDLNPFNGRANAPGMYDSPLAVPTSGVGSSREVVDLLTQILAALRTDTSPADPLGAASGLRALLARADRIL
jgi:hypothetical protein